MKLHVFPRSPNARKTMWAAGETGVAVEINVIDLMAGEQKNPEFVALNPNAKIPVLEYDDGTSLWESNAIVNRLADLGDSELWPKTAARYEIVQWQFWESAHFTPAVAKFLGAVFFGAPLDRETAEPAMQKVSAVLDGHLAGRDWLVGDAMTTSDISVASALCYREACQLPMGDVPNIDRWMVRISSRENW